VVKFLQLATGVAWSHPTSMWKTGREHAKKHESCDCIKGSKWNLEKMLSVVHWI